MKSAHDWTRQAGGIAVFAIAFGLLPGCGGGDGPTQKDPDAGRFLTITFPWPSRARSSRALPPTTQSVVVQVRDARGFQDEQIINRPENVGSTFGQAQFFALSEGTAQVQARAYSASDAEGQILAEAGQVISLSRNNTDAATLTFTAAYTSLLVQPETPGASLNLLQGATLRLVARGAIADGTIVELSPAGAFSTSNASVAAVNPTTGLVTATGPGNVTITFSDAFGRAGSLDLTVRGGDAEVSIQ